MLTVTYSVSFLACTSASAFTAFSVSSLRVTCAITSIYTQGIIIEGGKLSRWKRRRLAFERLSVRVEVSLTTLASARHTPHKVRRRSHNYEQEGTPHLLTLTQTEKKTTNKQTSELTTEKKKNVSVACGTDAGTLTDVEPY
jgi:hypothetical protein